MKRLVFFFVLVLAFSTLSTLALASDSETLLTENNTPYYQETGQINLDGLKLSVNRSTGVLEITQSILSDSVATEKMELINHLYSNNELKNLLSTIINKGDSSIAAIGYTTVHLKQVSDENGTYVEPLTITEMASLKESGSISPFAAGPITSYGSLTLYTAATITVRNSVKIVDAYSVAHWSSGVGTGSTGPATGRDYISLSLPSEYILTGSSLSGGYNSFKSDEDYSSVVYGFNEWALYEYAPDINLVAYGRSTSEYSQKKFVSKYVHTWASVTPSISIDSTGVSFSFGTSEKAWQIASSIIINS